MQRSVLCLFLYLQFKYLNVNENTGLFLFIIDSKGWEVWEGWGRISSHTGIMNSTSASGPGSGAAARMGNVLLPMVMPPLYTYF